MDLMACNNVITTFNMVLSTFEELQRVNIVEQIRRESKGDVDADAVTRFKHTALLMLMMMRMICTSSSNTAVLWLMAAGDEERRRNIQAVAEESRRTVAQSQTARVVHHRL